MRATVLALWFAGLAAYGASLARADDLLAVALSCPAGVAASDCDRGNATDVLTQPVAIVTACAQVGQHLAAHLSLAPGGQHKIVCERRRG